MLAVVVPVVAEYLPVPQSVQAPVPVAALYLPAAQAEHAPPLGPVYPRLQTQLLTEVPPLRRCEFAGQAKQVLTDVAPSAAENVPAPQAVHVLAPIPAEYLPVPQSMQPISAFLEQNI